MILLLGGTSEAGTIAAALAAAGVRVLVSTATDFGTPGLEAAGIAVRTGILDEAGLRALIAACGARAVVDATHPYAAEVTENARRAAAGAGVPYLRYLRPAVVAAGKEVVSVADHGEAARRAFHSGRPVLLTIGTRHLAPYLREARRTSVPLVARVLPAPESLLACAAAGLAPECVIQGQGPFSVDQTVEDIRRHGIGVLVTKDGGAAGGVPEKLEAARREGCAVVMVARPAERTPAGCVFSEVRALVDSCLAAAAGPAASAS